MFIRLQKYLAEAGVCSRRKAEQLILDGKVSINGVVVTELGTKVEEQKDTVTFQGKRIRRRQEYCYLMLHKPEGYVTTVKDQFDRPTVLDLLSGIRERVYPVGRLDYDTSGLLLLTNDGDLTYKLTHPKHEIEKTYVAKLFGTPTQAEINQFQRGMTIDRVQTAPAKIEIIEAGEKYCICRIIIREGRNRQVRKMCEAIRHPVASLKRTGTGKLALGELPKGKFRFLTDTEIKYLKQI